MVIVTDSNFLDAAGTLRKGLLYCDFVAIDFEFLGLDVSAISLHDTVESRYQILRDNVIKYRPCQLGLTLFKQKSNRAYKADTYSVPLFQRFGDNDTSISLPSMRFLVKNKFNLNQVFMDGVEFCTRKEFKKFERALLAGTAASYLSREVKSQIELLKVMVHEKCYQSTSYHITHRTDEPMQKIPLKMKPNSSVSLRMPRNLSSVEKYMIIYELTKAFPQFLFTCDEKQQNLHVKNISDDYLKEKDNLERARARCSESVKGVSAILQVVHMTGKLVVGHNSLLDAMYMYHYFFSHLPANYQMFKDKFNALFPRIMDTKLLAQALRFELPGVGDSLENLGDYFGSDKSDKTVPPELRGFIEPWMNPLEDESENVYHNAGFDSYVTGEVFLKLAHIYINRRNNFKNEILDFDRIYQYLEAPILNRLPFQLMDVGCCYLTGDDSKGFRPDVITIVRRDRVAIEEDEFRYLEKALGTLMATYQFDIEWSKNKKELFLATNSPGSYAFLCEKFSNDSSLAPLDELDSGKKWTFEQRQTAWRSFKNRGVGIGINAKRIRAQNQATKIQRAMEI
ncbi:3'-5' exoribonuclease parn-1 [Caenorhabditis elegans]|uniref:3'-5' exoribonuclease parn-1 n=1 Tax=Caenorhabditis elegans TaxID=6239 RepID=PARN1_CAEEL|nr:3'-5' exoribonuclease parn-1 [Caenorhabditis elegans]Q21412.2 RecName: Full=3'-5' exoribonuclease parn-1; AltName: Full=Poly(A)-specific ribonuclease homolog 1; AltName: Full=RNase parn-1 [Caenorhabditis elegans]CAA98954.2 3'-5' exoribonuclease parn-1 [Caenorhabditis elegans]|eukprot:NP_506169.2 3'-5' exoribonuclease parn-1 [Caenorhabditis elegans]